MFKTKWNSIILERNVLGDLKDIEWQKSLNVDREKENDCMDKSIYKLYF